MPAKGVSTRRVRVLTVSKPPRRLQVGGSAETEVGVGAGRYGDDNERIPMDIKVGDKVVYSKYGGTEIKVGGEEVIILRADDVLGVLN